MSHIEVISMGCRLNAYESEVMRQHATEAHPDKTITIINTCAVTSEAERQARQMIRRARKDRPDAQIIVTGCASQINPQRYADMPEVDVVLGNEEKMSPQAFDVHEERVRVNDIMELKETALHMVDAYAEHTRAFVQIQNGCNHRCTFCIIPYGRGNSRSVAMGEIVQQVRALVERGYKEIVFTGVDISAYGEDLPNQPTLGTLVKRVLKAIPELPRLRLSSIDAVEVDDALYDAIGSEERLLPYMHISLQAGDDMILKRMKRRHNRADAIAFCNRVRDLRPDMIFGADLIAGFPTETDAMFANSLALVEEIGLPYLHVFPYSEREGTPAAKMPQVAGDIRRERARVLREAGARVLDGFLDQKIGTSMQVLVEQHGRGHCQQFADVCVPESAMVGSIVELTCIGREGMALIGQMHNER
ncbi:MAG: tRNA (N(6)-L-threonylcarbamoyladenosine(37)-C(2))-methylthiotransferase MtaB [Alphaproteobacteria bacterium]|nr:MAG: tRNA (N(6)-L-threonylcarbamoyladenosine(37)-C(2))-methylthiotransferase MtaB [Alphaproteobacteria bacterium]